MEIIDHTPMSEADGLAWFNIASTVGAAVLAPRVVSGRMDPNGGSAVLVCIGGREFLLTAGHVVHDEDKRLIPREKIAIQFPRLDKLFLTIEPGKRHVDILTTYEPDVAVVELDASERAFWRNHRPIPTSRFASPEVRSARERFLVLGVSGAETEEGPGALPPEQSGNVVTVRRELRSGLTPVVTFAYRDIDNEHAPTDGRCFHVGWDHVGHLGNDDTKRIDPHGVSGGPVIAVDRSPPQLVGLVRSTFREKFLLCEPLAPALRLLLGHHDQTVRDDALATLVRLNASAP